jgi:nucleoside recognition membrane protein YjiH
METLLVKIFATALAATLVTSLALGAFFFIASASVTGANRGLEGMLWIVLLISMIGLSFSGIMLLMIGPSAIADHLRRTTAHGRGPG